MSLDVKHHSANLLELMRCNCSKLEGLRRK
jgi:hypothetical protein